MLRSFFACALALGLGCAHAPPPSSEVACPEPPPAVAPREREREPAPLPAPTATVDEFTAQVLTLEVVANRAFEEVGSFAGMKVGIEVRSTGRGILGLVPERSVIRTIEDDRGVVLFDEAGAHGPVGMTEGFTASTGFGQGPERITVDLRVPTPSTGAREVIVDADLALMVGGEPEAIETPLRVAVGETFALGGVAFSVSRVAPSRRENAAVELHLRATDGAVAKALLGSLEVVTDAGPVPIVDRSWATWRRPAQYTELQLDLASEVENVTLRGKLPSDLELVILPFRTRLGIGSVSQPTD